MDLHGMKQPTFKPLEISSLARLRLARADFTFGTSSFITFGTSSWYKLYVLPAPFFQVLALWLHDYTTRVRLQCQ